MHRDIKPSNILLDTRTSSGKLVGSLVEGVGKPFCYLVDFGIAAAVIWPD